MADKNIDKANKDIKTNLKKQNDLNFEIAAQGLIVKGLLVEGNVPTEEDSVYNDFKNENDELQKLQNKLEKLSKDYNDLIKSIEKSTQKIEKKQKKYFLRIKNYRVDVSRIYYRNGVAESREEWR